MADKWSHRHAQGHRNASCDGGAMRCKGPRHEMVTLSHGRSIPRSIYRRFRLWLHFVVFATLLPFFYLVLASPLSTEDLLATAALVHDAASTAVEPAPLLGCVQRCWMKSYTYIAATITWFVAPLLCALTIPLALGHIRSGREALRLGGDPYAKLPVGFTIERISSFGQALRIVFGIVLYFGLLWFAVHATQSMPGDDWEIRRGARFSPAQWVFAFSFMLGVVQFLAVSLTSFVVFALVSIIKPFHRKAYPTHG